MDWAKPPQRREQLVMFPTRLDEAIGQEHAVRLLDAILRRLDWAAWEATYDRTRGQPPIHPRVIASVILYGLLTRIRSTRALEEALAVRLDFLWLAEGRSIDHATIAKFRVGHADRLKDLFVQVGMLARELGWLTLQTLAFDGTRIRANNRRSGSRTPEELRSMRAELAAKYAELEQKIAQADEQEEALLGDGSPSDLQAELADAQQRITKIDAVLDQLTQLEKAERTLPKRLPMTDPDSRITPNKDGGFAPNYTPLATVDVDSGLIVSADVIPHTDEDKHLIAALDDVQASFDLPTPPAEMLADGLMATGENLAQCKERGVVLYSPIAQGPADNPAIRSDPTQPVAAEDRERLPTKTTKSKGGETTKLDRQAFIFDADQNCYWCPEGKRLPFHATIEENRGGGKRVRHQYRSEMSDCDDCPLRAMCLSGRSRRRDIRHEQHESDCIEHRERMQTEEAKAKYARRRSPGERPFAVVKQQFGVRQFLTRGLSKVRQEWSWLSIAFNVKRLLHLITARPLAAA